MSGRDDPFYCKLQTPPPPPPPPPRSQTPAKNKNPFPESLGPKGAAENDAPTSAEGQLGQLTIGVDPWPYTYSVPPGHGPPPIDFASYGGAHGTWSDTEGHVIRDAGSTSTWEPSRPFYGAVLDIQDLSIRRQPYREAPALSISYPDSDFGHDHDTSAWPISSATVSSDVSRPGEDEANLLFDATDVPMISRGESSESASGSPSEAWSDAESGRSPGVGGLWDDEPVGRGLADAASRVLNEIVFRLVENYLGDAAVSPASEAGIRVVAPGARGQASDTTTSSIPASGPPCQNPLRRRRGKDRENDGRGQDSDDGASQRRRGKKPRSITVSPGRRLACPYWKLDQREHRGCFNRKLDAMPRVKYHLLVNHTPDFYCERCHATFTNDETHGQHVKAVIPCLPSAIDPPHITHRQRSQLAAKSRPKESETEQWFTVWDVLFPGRPRPSSAYIDDALTEDVCRFREYVEAHGPALITTALRDDPDLRQTLFTQDELLQLAISRGLTRVIDHWLAEDGTPPQAAGAAAVPLVPAPAPATGALTPTTESTGVQSGSESVRPSSQQDGPQTPASSAGLGDGNAVVSQDARQEEQQSLQCLDPEPTMAAAFDMQGLEGGDGGLGVGALDPFLFGNVEDSFLGMDEVLMPPELFGLALGGPSGDAEH